MMLHYSLTNFNLVFVTSVQLINVLKILFEHEFILLKYKIHSIHTIVYVASHFFVAILSTLSENIRAFESKFLLKKNPKHF